MARHKYTAEKLIQALAVVEETMTDEREEEDQVERKSEKAYVKRQKRC